MGFGLAFRAPAGARSWAVATLAAALMALVAVAPVAAERGPVRLADPSVSPVQVNAGQSITFTVVYSNGQGNGPASIVVVVGSARYAMSAPAGTTNFGGGVTYTAVAAPPAGTWAVEFIATDKFGNTATLAGASLTVVAPAPTPKPTPRPTPAPTPRPSPGQTSVPTPGAAGAGSGSAGTGASSGAGSGTGGTAPGTGGATSSGDGSTGGSGSMVGTPNGPDDGVPPWQRSRRGAAAVAPSGAAPSGAAAATTTAGSGTVSGDDWKNGDWRTAASGATSASAGDDWKNGEWRTASTSAPASVGDDWKTGAWRAITVGGAGAASLPASLSGALGGSSGVPLEQLLTTAVVTLGGVAMAMSFMLFGRRRRDDDPTDTDEALAAAAAMGPGAVGTGALVGSGRRGVAPTGVGSPEDAELDLPRWRRPSLLAARKEDPLRVVHSDAKQTFDHGAVAPIDGVERRTIRYRLVRLLDSPDELVAGEVGFLDEGDEVQLLRRSGSYWLVLCPDGREGWVHRMVLGEVVGDAPAEPSDDRRGPADPDGRERSFLGSAAGIRLASQGTTAWSLQGAAATDAGMDIDEDVLRAYLAARGRG